jgi:hypothetical protein
MRTLRSIRFLFMAPFILVLLVVINWMTSPGHWWVQWAALGLGIAWFIALFRVMRALVVVGGLAALGAWLAQRSKSGGGGPNTGF